MYLGDGYNTEDITGYCWINACAANAGCIIKIWG